MKRSNDPAWVKARLAALHRKADKCDANVARDPDSMRVPGWKRSAKEARAHAAILELGTETPEADVVVPAAKLKAKGSQA